MAFYLTSPAFAEGKPIPARHACTGEDLSPELHWSDPPAGTKSFALIMDDPDAPAGVWVHWVVWNIPADRHSLAEGQPRQAALPGGMHQGPAGGVDTFRKVGYGGPCPPSGEHRYYFRFYALDTVLNVAADTNAFRLRKAMVGHILGQTELMGTFRR